MKGLEGSYLFATVISLRCWSVYLYAMSADHLVGIASPFPPQVRLATRTRQSPTFFRGGLGTFHRGAIRSFSVVVAAVTGSTGLFGVQNQGLERPAVHRVRRRQRRGGKIQKLLPSSGWACSGPPSSRRSARQLRWVGGLGLEKNATFVYGRVGITLTRYFHPPQHPGPVTPRNPLSRHAAHEDRKLNCHLAHRVVQYIVFQNQPLRTRLVISRAMGAFSRRALALPFINIC